MGTERRHQSCDGSQAQLSDEAKEEVHRYFDGDDQCGLPEKELVKCDAMELFSPEQCTVDTTLRDGESRV